MGKSIILITHKLNEVMAVSDRIFIMRSGKYIDTLKKEETSIEEISYLMVGRKIPEKHIKKQERKDLILKLDNINLKENGKSIIKDLSMEIYGGEIVGIAGVSGNGQSELIEILTGLRKLNGGKIYLNGKEIENKDVDSIRKQGLAVIPEDRYLWGCAKDANLIETAIMSHQRKEEFSKSGLLKNDNIKKFTTDILEKYDVRYSSLNQKAGELSGGNLQKLIVGREIEENKSLLIAAEPTRGVDIGAIEDIHEKLIEKRNNMDAILLISSELSEILSLSDRIYTIYEGSFNGHFTREEANSKDIGLKMMGGVRNE